MGYKHLHFSENSKFLITGGAGFIGSNLCEAILNMGYKVFCLDDMSTGKQTNVDMLINHPNYTFIKGDIKDFNTCMKATENIDFVLHEAAWGSIQRSIEMPVFYEENNIGGTLNMMEAAHRNNVKKFIYASSSSVYGDEPNLPRIEGREGNLISPYALTKRVNEQYGKLYTQLYKLDTYGLRYFNVFGRRQNPDCIYAAVIPRFIKMLINEEIPVIYGDGQQSRDFTYIENVIEANLKACLAPHEIAGDIFNIASGEREYIIDVYYTISAAIGKCIDPIFNPHRKGEVKHSYSDITKAKRLLGYDPDYNFKKGLDETIDWYILNYRR